MKWNIICCYKADIFGRHILTDCCNKLYPTFNEKYVLMSQSTLGIRQTKYYCNKVDTLKDLEIC